MELRLRLLIHMLDGTRAAGSTLARLWLTLPGTLLGMELRLRLLIHMLDGTRAVGSTLARLWLTPLDIEGCQPVNPAWRVLSTLLDIQSLLLSMWAPASSITLMESSVIHPVVTDN